MARRPKGILTRNVPDWYCQKLFAAQIQIAAVAGQASNCGIFNGSGDGTVYYVYAVGIFVSLATFVNFKLEKGQNYSVYSANNAQRIDQRLGSGTAILEAGTNAACLGTHIGGMPCIAGANPPFAPGWPLLVVPPGYAGVIESANANITLQIGIYWLELRGGGF